MNMQPLRPKSTTGLQRLAHGLKKHRDLTQSEAMEHAAVLAGYRNLREAQLAFGETPAPSVLITAQFYDEIGRKTLETRVPLSRNLRSFLRPKHLRVCDRFEKMTMVAEDYIEAEFNHLQESHVRQRIARTARTLQFMDVTGLKPSTDEIYGYPTWSKQHRLPGQDHALTWFDPETETPVMMDEPYGYVDHLFPNRNVWAERNGFVVRRLNWGGTYRPEQGSVCDLVSRVGQGVFIDQIIARLEQAEPGFREELAPGTLHVGA
jgi:hypothetical protein